MKLKFKIFTVIAGVILAFAVSLIIYFSRSPVLIVIDQALIPLYGETRIRRETFFSSVALFRRFFTVYVADDAGDDIVQFAIADVSSSPFCVLFPYRFARSARLYRERHPQIPVVLLEGRRSQPVDTANDYFVYKTDIYSDFYRAGLISASLDTQDSKTAVFLESFIHEEAAEAFLQAQNSMEKPAETTFFTSFYQFYETPNLSCVVLAGEGVEYLENYTGVPVILFTWIDPSLVPADVVLVFDDSPWAQAAPAVRMAAAGMEQGRIQSKIHVINSKFIESRTLRKIQKQGQNI